MTTAHGGDDGMDHDGMDDVLRELDDDATKSGLENERIQFFLKHHPLILEWQALANETWAEVKNTLADLEVELGDRASAAGFSVATRVVGQDPMGPVLYRANWCLEVAGEPDVGFTIGWDSRPDPSGTWPKTSRPYYGILPGGVSDEDKRRLRHAHKPFAADSLKRSDPMLEGFQLGNPWAVYLRFDASAKWYVDIARWRGTIADSFVKAATIWADVIDEGLEIFRGGAGGLPPVSQRRGQLKPHKAPR